MTDYASVQFDFAVTGKPILYVTYDLEHHHDDLRHFYVDFEQVAPGPQLATVEELLDALSDVHAGIDGYRERYDRFRERFCSRGDGHATARVLDLVLPEPVPADAPG